MGNTVNHGYYTGKGSVNSRIVRDGIWPSCSVVVALHPFCSVCFNIVLMTGKGGGELKIKYLFCR